MRTLSSLDSKYHPTLYHDGAVWSLVTGCAERNEIWKERTGALLSRMYGGVTMAKSGAIIWGKS